LQRTYKSLLISLKTKLGNRSIAPGSRHSFTKKKSNRNIQIFRSLAFTEYIHTYLTRFKRSEKDMIKKYVSRFIQKLDTINISMTNSTYPFKSKKIIFFQYMTIPVTSKFEHNMYGYILPIQSTSF
jgi:hypothetical protein